MNFSDMLRMSLGNLWRRKLRTFLTILGVLIGTASIVGMLSLALGMQKMIMEEYSSFGSATQITVNSGDNMDGGQMNEDTMLTDTNLEMMSGLEHVVSVDPVLSFDLIMKIGKYEGCATLQGMSRSRIDSLELAEGELPDTESGRALPVVIGNTVITSFYYARGDMYYDYYSTGELPDIDLMKQLRQGTYYDYSSYSDETSMESDMSGSLTDDSADDTDGSDSGTDDGMTNDNLNMGTEDESQKTFLLNPVAVMAGGPEDYSDTSSTIVVDLDTLKTYLNKTFGKGSIPGQPKKKGKPYKEWVYNSFVINVDKTEHVEDTMSMIQDMGFQASSNKDLLDSASETIKIIELVLGGIGMVAFLVAAIGIANTMMMSTYERTKEIGIMKVLGCDMRDIRKLFLEEAGFIGLLGGVMGILFTFGLSAVINYLARNNGMNGNISIIPWWLILVALAFSTLMGMLAGYFPARRAMKLSPLAAIRTE